MSEETARLRMLRYINLVKLIETKSLDQISDDFEVSKSMVQKVVTEQIRLVKPTEDVILTDELLNPLLGLDNAWMNSPEREYVKRI
jgi:hypothetical protein